MAPSNLRLLNRLRKAITKVRFLLSFNLRQWLLFPTSAPSSHRLLSLDNQPPSPGLLDVAGEFSYYLFDPLSSSPPTRPSSSGSKPLRRTISRAVSGSSNASSIDDIDQRAENFIENFYRQLRMERQVSLELRYCDGKGGFLEE
ncbi:uncharacterized protein LOC110023609 [Phalaenopsis equestris]|uniref:uncharacterized protein LOC110023609 n=1 Tax=Phalaenopsis equestris TaxID=78828 RepID=UPI0009E233D4|nr:uncharacterized protein LOC110023609 [Phalaenopsis equestris]